jgi:hypothetical protein
MRMGGGGRGYLVLPGFYSLYDAIQGWMVEASGPRRPLLYVISIYVASHEILLIIRSFKMCVTYNVSSN